MKGYFLNGYMYHVNDNIGRDSKENAKKGIRIFPIAPTEKITMKNGEVYQFNINKSSEAIEVKPFKSHYKYYEAKANHKS